MKSQIAITGVSGFLGGVIAKQLMAKNYPIISIGRTEPVQLVGDGATHFTLQDMSASSNYGDSLADVSCIIHCAALAGRGITSAASELDEFRKVNVQGTVQLANQAKASGVKRFIFISSAKVFGETSPEAKPFTAQDTPRPEDPYAITKYEAELALQDICNGTDMECVIVRPPLVYGPGVKANFQNLVKLAMSGIPLPFKSVDNRRSMVYVDNLADLVIACIDAHLQNGQILLAGDNHDVSLSRLISTIDNFTDKKSRIFAFNPGLLRLMLRTIGKRSVERRLLDSLQIDCSETMKLLNWQPPVSWEQAVAKTVSDYIKPKFTS